jgi:mannose-6-phosphate isomerase class I
MSIATNGKGHHLFLRWRVAASFLLCTSSDLHLRRLSVLHRRGWSLDQKNITECWYILSAEPGATVVHGFNKPTQREEVRTAIENMTLDRLLHQERVQAGDVIFVPDGTVHTKRNRRRGWL